MGEYITLLGSEDVSRAGYTMRDAAQTMQNAASNMSYTFEQHQRFLDDWLSRFEQVMEKNK